MPYPPAAATVLPRHSPEASLQCANARRAAGRWRRPSGTAGQQSRRSGCEGSVHSRSEHSEAHAGCGCRLSWAVVPNKSQQSITAHWPRPLTYAHITDSVHPSCVLQETLPYLLQRLDFLRRVPLQPIVLTNQRSELFLHQLAWAVDVHIHIISLLLIGHSHRLHTVDSERSGSSTEGSERTL